MEAESRILKQSSQQRERQFSELNRCLKLWECLPEERRFAYASGQVSAGFTNITGTKPTRENLEMNRDRKSVGFYQVNENFCIGNHMISSAIWYKISIRGNFSDKQNCTKQWSECD